MNETSIIFAPDKDSEEFRSADRFEIPLSSVTGFTPGVGDTIEIEYNGYIYASYPALLGEVYSVTLLSPSVDNVVLFTQAVYTSWIDPAVLMEDCTNYGKLLVSPDSHLPVIKIDSKDDWNRFVEKNGAALNISGWNIGEPPLFIFDSASGEDPFKDYFSLLIYVESPSSAFTYDMGDTLMDQNIMTFHIVRSNNPEIYTDDMSGFFLVASLRRSFYSNVDEFDAVLDPFAETTETSANQSPAYELQDFETETVISTFNYDLTHDGKKDTVQVSFVTTDGFDGVIGDSMFNYGLMGFVKVFDGSKGEPSDSSLIWSHDYALAHAGNYQFSITQKNGKDYLVETCLYEGQGDGNYEYEVLAFENNATTYADINLLQFKTGDNTDKSVFFDSLYNWINDDSILLMAADIDIDRYIYSTNDNIVHPDEYYHRKISRY